MRIYLSILLCCSQFLAYTQDTIYKRNGDIIASKIIEINPTTVSFKRFDLLDGPMFVTDKNEIKKIKYQIGAIDSFNVAIKKPIKEEKSWVVMGGNQNPQTESSEMIQLTRHPAKFKYKGQAINDKKALMLVSLKNRSMKNKELEFATNAARDHHRNQLLAGFGGAGLGLLSALVGINMANQNYANQATTGVFLIGNGVGLFIAGQIVSGSFKSKRMKNTKKAIELYNQNL